MFLNKIIFSSKEEKVRFLIIFFIGSLFLVGVYAVSYYVIIYIFSLPIIGTIFMLKIFALLILTSFVMLIFSSLINSFSTIYNCEDTEFLISLPIKLEKIFLTKFFGTYTKSVWMLLILLIPFLVAFSWIKNFSVIEFLVILYSLKILMLISVSIGVLVSVLLSYFFVSKKLKDISVIIIILFATIGYTIFRFIEPEKILNPDKFTELVQYLDFLSQPVGKSLPSWWMTEVLRGCLTKNYVLIYHNVLKLTFVTILFFCIVYFFAKKMFYKGLFGDKKFYYKKIGSLQNIQPLKSKFFCFKNSPMVSIIKKDLKQFFREPVQWTQIVVVVALIIVYIFSIAKIPVQYQYVKTTVTFFNLGSIMFMITSLSLRFVFVQPSMEYKMFWILKSAPIENYKIFFSKIILFLPMMTIFSWIIIFLSNIVLNLEIFMWILTFVVVTISCFVITGLGYSLGILFPKKDFQDIVQIETSFGGLMFIIISLSYIILILTTISYPVRQYILGNKITFNTVIFYTTNFILVNLLYTIPTGYYSYKKFSLQIG